jgi:hypothetical protein
MRGIAKIVRGDEYRRSRLHTEADEIVGIDALPGLAAAAAGWAYARTTGRRVVSPWWVYSSIGFVRRALRGQDRVLELGSGYSTLWLGARVGEIVSIEESPVWSAKIKDVARRHGLLNVRLIDGKPAADFPRQLAVADWDVVVIDSDGDRVPLFEALVASSMRPRLIIYDNTDRDRDRPAARRGIPGYTRHVFCGFAPHTIHASETTVFRRISSD